MSDATPRDSHTLRLAVSPDGQPREAVSRAAELLRAGQLVAFPTETVYGLGADATNPAAVEGIFAAKGRPHSDPLIVHIAEMRQLPDVVSHVPDSAARLAERFWPGPLTLVLPGAASIPASVTAGGDTVGVRMPSHPVARLLLAAANVPVAAPSANRFMHTSPTTAAHVLADLDGRIACVLDGGPATVGVESTVLDLTTEPARVLRPGGVTLEELREVLPDVLGPRRSEASSEREELTATAARAPGQMPRHYAPHTPLVVFDAPGQAGRDAVRREAERALAGGQRVGALLSDEDARALADLPVRVEPLGPSADLAGISRRLYAALRSLDDGSLDLLLAHTFGKHGMGLALEDRLRRAAGGTLRPV